ncbi:MAG TPA: effector binding domain-containing protein [Bacillota bacterium]|nr:effector binding domain-containing protein [Bacillota bacterium]
MIQPGIIERNEAVTAVGLMVRTTEKTVFKDLPKVYSQYMDINKSNRIPNMKQPWEYVSLSTNFEGNQTWDYYTGHVVTSSGSIAGELVEFQIPQGIYAVFPIRCKFKLFFGLKVGQMKRYIYTQWLPSSEYEFAGFEYEYNNETMAQVRPYNIDLYVGIKKKNT